MSKSKNQTKALIGCLNSLYKSMRKDLPDISIDNLVDGDFFSNKNWKHNPPKSPYDPGEEQRYTKQCKNYNFPKGKYGPNRYNK